MILAVVDLIVATIGNRVLPVASLIGSIINAILLIVLTIVEPIGTVLEAGPSPGRSLARAWSLSRFSIL